MTDIELKPAFVERYQELLGERYDEFISCSTQFLRRCIRVNTLKTTVEEVQKRLSQNWNLTPVPWCPEAFWIEHKGEMIDGELHKRRDVGNLPEHALGYIYIQESASMIPPQVLQPAEHATILDMCAAPGSKTSQCAAMMNNTGLLVANELTMTRLSALKSNLQRCGVQNAIITHMDGRSLKGSFDGIMVDAPCSGTGTIRKSLKTLSMWNPKMVSRLGRIQLTLLAKAYELTKPGGTIVYSTCTLEPEENEGVVHTFLQRFPIDIEPISLDIVRSNPIMSFNGTTYDERVANSLRIYPMDNDSEGFFICRLRKRE